MDTEGLEGLNMRALSNRLGSAATAVYWRTAASSMATDLRAMLTRHPWLMRVLGSAILDGLEAQLTTRSTPSEQNTRKPRRDREQRRTRSRMARGD